MRWVIATLLVAAIAAATVIVIDRRSNADDNDPAAPTEATTPGETATVEQRDIVQTEDVDGTLGYGPRTTVKGTGLGVITGLPAAGTVIELGQQLWERDGLPGPTLIYGDRPFWRTIDSSADDGEDIRTLEYNLVAMGFATAEELTVDDDWTSATTRAVKKWQKSLGVKQDGIVELGEMVVASGPIRVAKLLASVGVKDDVDVMETTGTTRIAHVDLKTTQTRLVNVGDAVDIELPDGTIVAGTIYGIGKAVDKDADSGETTIDLDIALNEDPGGYDDAPIKVHLTKATAEGVLAVPVAALLALAEGGYAVEKVGADGSSQLIPVELGAFADGWVEISGDLSEGDEVVVPS